MSEGESRRKRCVLLTCRLTLPAHIHNNTHTAQMTAFPILNITSTHTHTHTLSLSSPSLKNVLK